MRYSTGLSPSFVRGYADKTPPWGPVGYLIYKRTYARLMSNQGRTEEWADTCARACNGLVEIGGLFTERELEQLFDAMFHLKGSVSGRALWQLGTATVRRIGADSLCNCWLVTINKLDAFCFTFNQLMLGGGVGANIQAQYVYELPPVKHDVKIERVDTPDCDFVMPDNREGWVELLWRVLKAFFHTGKDFRYSSQCIRPAGRPIASFGGVASGSEGLVAGIDKIVKILRSRVGTKLRPLDAGDILNIIATVVVAGNVRRSSMILIGDPGDTVFLRAKNWSLGTVPNWRAQSNNSIAADYYAEITPEFWEGFRGQGECYGLVNLRNCRRFGRLADGLGYRMDMGIVGVNPCSEANLWSKEPCNLAETFLPNIRDAKEWASLAVLFYKACKTITKAQYSDPETDAIVHENYRIGVGLTGWQAAPQFRRADILTEVYRTLERADEDYSRRLGVKPSKRLTTIKPSGTLSLLPFGCPPGMHAAFARYLIRRIRFAANDPLVEACRAAGYHVEPKLELDGSPDHGTMVVSFPVDMGANCVTEDQITVTDQLETQRFLQTYWADQSISCTHYFKRGELKDIRGWLEHNYDNAVKTCSFLPSTGHGFAQAPLEKITEDQYRALRDRCRPVTHLRDERETDHADNLECAGGICPVK